MSFKNIIFVTVMFCFCVFASYAQTLESFVKDYDKSDMYQIKKAHEQVWKDVPQDQQRGWKQYKRWEYFWSQRLYPNATYKQAIKIYSDIEQQITDKHFETTQANEWKLIGPTMNPKAYGLDSKGIGRVNVVRFHPTDPNTIWIGTATGGVWKTHNKGATWEDCPFTQFLSLGVSDIAISPTNPNIVYVATGDADGSLGTANFFSSIGIIKSTDGGATWQITGMSSELEDYSVISRLIVHPQDPNKVLAATREGIFKTIDGGTTWQKNISGNFRDLEIKRNNPNFLYAATGYVRSNINYIYTTEDFGDTWIQKHAEPMAGRIQMAVSYLDPDMMVAICSQYLHSGLSSIIVTENSGETFSVVIDSSYGNLLNWGYDLGVEQRGQSYYDLCIAISDNSSSNIIIGGIECYKTTNSGSTWQKCTNTNVKNDVHVDMHDLAYNPLNNELYLCNDGGIYCSKDEGVTWTDISDGLSITQHYRVGMSTKDPNLIVCGAQDNGTSMFIKDAWYSAYGGDGMDCAIDPQNDNKIYFSSQYGNFGRSFDKGKTSQELITPKKINSKYGAKESGDWISPFAIDPNNSSTLYVCYNNVWRSTNAGESWTKISKFSSSPITWFSIAPSNSNYLYVVIRNALYMTSNAGLNWTRIPIESNNTITSVCVSPTNPQQIWYSLSGYDPNSKVFMYDGTSFTNLSGNLPNVPVNTIVYQKNTNDRLYIGTDIGVFYSENKSNIWDNINTNLPKLIISELEIFYGSKVPKLRAATYGRGLWETDVITCENEALNITPYDSVINICPHEFVELTAEGDYSDYTWTDGTKGKTLITNKSGNYSVTSMNGDCKLRSKTVTVRVAPTSGIKAIIKNDAPACIGDTLEINATLGFQKYLWSTGDTTRKILITKSGNYSVKGIKSNETCESYSDTLHVEFVPKPTKPTFETHGSRLVATEDSTLSYQWYIGNTLIKGAKSRIYQPDSSGTYKLLVTNKNGCSAFSNEIYVAYSSVSDSESLGNIIIAPNPSKGVFGLGIKCQQNDLIEYTVTNSIGQTLFSKTIRSNSEMFDGVVDLENQVDGVYMLIIKINGSSKTVKLIKK